MMIRTRLSIAVIAASLSLVGCVGDDEEQQVVTESYVGFDPVVASADNANLPANQQRGPVIPFPFDALFAGAKTPTLNIPNATNSNLVANANMLDGFSTTASWFIDIFGIVDLDTVANVNPSLSNLMIINGSTGLPLVYKTDFEIQTSTVKDTSGIPINAQRTRILIEPLKPLAPNTTYIVALKKGIKTTNGGMVQPSYMFKFLNSDTPIASRTDSYLTRFSANEKATLDALRSQLVRPIVTKLAGFGITDVLLAYSVTTQSTTKTLDKVAAATVASNIVAFPTGKTPTDLNPAFGDFGKNSNVYLGTLEVPYYGDTPVSATAENKAPILSSYWKADPTQSDATAGFLGKAGACGAYAAGLTVNGIKLEPSKSTTVCFPMPVKQSNQTIPMLITVPKVAKPEGGWPVVIFQHGITGNRTNMLPIASAFAQAGYVTVAIDLPLHGITPTDAASALRITGVSERTFDVDSAGEYNGAYDQVTKDADGKDVFKNSKGRLVASSGSFFINLPNPISSRDNLRQGAADILVLAKSLGDLNLDGVLGGDINTSKIRFSGISLGAIVGTVALGADNAKTIGAASLSVGSGGIGKMLDASRSYGPIISNGLINALDPSKTVSENSDNYETFMRFAQTLADSGDPINYAVAAKNNHPLHLSEVLGDLVVPNKAKKTTSLAESEKAYYDYVGATGFLSGTDALARVMGLDQSMSALDIGAITAEQKINPTGLGIFVKFKQGKHASLIDPRHPKDEVTTDAIEATAEEKATSFAVTQEMQRQTVNFIVSNGVCLPIGQNCSF